tara:strand:+ start:1867 stop:2640 length:774 start_codon:yes stop_codon:yes gene_type:complete
MNIIDMLSNYLEHKSIVNTKIRYAGKENYFQASSAGNCFKKQMFRYTNSKKSKDIDEKTRRVFRLGDLIHKDFEECIKDKMLNDAEFQRRYIVFIEQEVINKSLNVRGHLDFAYIDRDNSNLVVIDFKSANSYQWRKRFGQLKNRDKNPSYQYEMQLGTYADALNNVYGEHVKNIELQLIWYKKDDSIIKIQPIPIEKSIPLAVDYWENLNEIFKENNIKENTTPFEINESLKREKDYGVPFIHWECKYCNWEGICN